MNDKARGLYEKYVVHRLGDERTKAKHAGCEYFVLDLFHDKHAMVALAAYAESCRQEYPLLAHDLHWLLAAYRRKQDEQISQDHGEPV